MKEEQIRKRDIFNRYLKLVAEDIKDLFDFKSFVKIDCPACGGRKFIFEFEQLGFKYVSCRDCLTLFVNPRPSLEMLKRFYSDSSSANYFVNEFFKPVAEVRREKIFKERAKRARRVLGACKGRIIGDIGAGFGIFLEELREILPDNRYIAIEPSPDMAQICMSKNLEVKHMCLEEMDKTERFDLLTAFELFEHLFDPASFLKKVYEHLRPGGYLYITTLNGRGFDIQLLWERSKSLTPPHHLDFFNPSSAGILLEKTGFEVLEISTPGRLDWDIVEGMIKKENVNLGRFWNSFAKEGDQISKDRLQEWISENRLSSHMRMLAKRSK